MVFNLRAENLNIVPIFSFWPRYYGIFYLIGFHGGRGEFGIFLKGKYLGYSCGMLLENLTISHLMWDSHIFPPLFDSTWCCGLSASSSAVWQSQSCSAQLLLQQMEGGMADKLGITGLKVQIWKIHYLHALYSPQTIYTGILNIAATGNNGLVFTIVFWHCFIYQPILIISLGSPHLLCLRFEWYNLNILSQNFKFDGWHRILRVKCSSKQNQKHFQLNMTGREIIFKTRIGVRWVAVKYSAAKRF